MSETASTSASGTSVDKTVSSSPSSPPRPHSVETLRSWLPLYLKKTDATINRLSAILSNPSGTDTVLLTLCYTSLLSSTVLSSISLRQLHKAARQIIEKAISLPPNTTVLIDASDIPSPRLLIISQRLKALSSLISDFRTFVRLWGLLGIWKWGKGLLDNPPEQLLLRYISYGQVSVNVIYQYLENRAYLSSKNILGWSVETQNKAWLWSARCWMVHVVLDFMRLYYEYALRRSASKGERSQDGTKEEEATDQTEGEWRAKWRREMVVNLAYAPLTVHWSLEKGLVGDFWVGLLGSVAGVTGIRELWKNTK